jgi:hypothetical protein
MSGTGKVAENVRSERNGHRQNLRVHGPNNNNNNLTLLILLFYFLERQCLHEFALFFCSFVKVVGISSRAAILKTPPTPDNLFLRSCVRREQSGDECI